MMTIAAPVSSLASRTLEQHNDRLRELRSIGESCAVETAKIFWDVWASGYVRTNGGKWVLSGHGKWLDGGHESFEDWAQSEGYKRAQAHNLKDAGQKWSASSALDAPKSLRQTNLDIREERKERREKHVTKMEPAAARRKCEDHDKASRSAADAIGEKLAIEDWRWRIGLLREKTQDLGKFPNYAARVVEVVKWLDKAAEALEDG